MAEETKAKTSKKSRKKRPEREPNSVPVVSRNVTLGSQQGFNVYRRTFDVTSEAFNQLGIVLRILTSDDKIVKTAEEFVMKKMTECEEHFKSELSGIKELLAQEGIAGKPEFTHPRQVTAKVTSRQSGTYLRLIIKMDEMIGNLALLWISGVLTDQQYRDTFFKWQSKLQTLSSEIRGEARRAMRAINDNRRQQQTDSDAPELPKEIPTGESAESDESKIAVNG